MTDARIFVCGVFAGAGAALCGVCLGGRMVWRALGHVEPLVGSEPVKVGADLDGYATRGEPQPAAEEESDGADD